ncbi:hypothetical protein [Streptomyces sp. NBC_01361]|uniref:hypothetical protein n=1 Tax=Streptomyces sp. NBC_01361 TaxID=2903838 RepID=UPI002E349663|nr:hypothetical protein [Streptomyces sp. NBC_01361]
MATDRQRAAAAKAKPKKVDTGIPAGYFGPRFEGQPTNLCHRHKRTIPLGRRCDIGRLEAGGEPVPEWVKVNPAKSCFSD